MSTKTHHSQKKALITGANGFVGSHLTKFLADQGIDTYAYILKGTNCDLLKILHPTLTNVTIIEGNVLDQASLEQHFQGMDYIFHLAGVITGYSQKDFDRINLQGTRNVIKACMQVIPDLERLVIISSLAAAGPGTAEDPQCEDKPATPILDDYYGVSKFKVECVANACMEDLPISIVRPCTVLGPGDRVSLDLFKSVKSYVKAYVGGARRKYSTVDVGDLTRGIYACATNPKAIGEIFFFSSNGTITWDELHEVINAKVFHRKYGSLINIAFPKWMFKILTVVMEAVYKIAKQPAPFLNQSKMLAASAPGQCVSNEKAKRLLGWYPQETIISTVVREGLWFQEQGWI
ncbi:GDP-L-fucose synthase [Candidatus Lokiarchaeum ossiferum]|uniref:GDP-L-fucose synthase n=1 Tax=Candidatus Lokiarchaeum ossiferum TaxID=2951803 RepID=A0ABY6HS59_9ARCH|nr:GDP-L-fucose synthase [Candidatus Lokiarchaeum sp. B-35]